MEEVAALLESIDLGQYVAKFKEMGYTDLDRIRSLNAVELETLFKKVAMKHGSRTVLKNTLAEGEAKAKVNVKENLKVELQDEIEFQMPTRENDLHELETACQQLESRIKKIASSNGNFKATRELSSNLDINKFNLAIAEKKLSQEPNINLRTLETECLQLESDMKVAYGKGNLEAADDFRVKLEIKRAEMDAGRKKSAEKSKIHLELVEKEMYRLICDLKAAAVNGNFKLVPEIQLKILAKKRVLDAAKMKTVELKFTALMLLMYQKKTKDMSLRPIANPNDDPICTECGQSFCSLLMLIRHQQSQPHCNKLSLSSKLSAAQAIQEGTRIQFTVKGKQFIGKVIKNTLGKFSHEVCVEGQVHKMHLNTDLMRMVDIYGNDVAFKLLNQKKDNGEEEKKNTEKDEYKKSQNEKNIAMNLSSRLTTQVEIENENTRRLNTVICVLENPNNADNVSAIVGNVDFLNIGKLYVVDGLNLLPDDWDTMTKDNSPAKYADVRTFKTTTECINYLSKNSTVSVATSPYTLGKKNVFLSQGIYTQPHLALWFGNEITGLSDEAFQHSLFCIQIQIGGIVESVNVAVATGIVFAAIVRQRLKIQQ